MVSDSPGPVKTPVCCAGVLRVFSSARTDQGRSKAARSQASGSSSIWPGSATRTRWLIHRLERAVSTEMSLARVPVNVAQSSGVAAGATPVASHP